MSDCLFCKILEGEIPADVLHRDDDCIAFRDVNPQAPTHFLVVPRRHIPTTDDLLPEDTRLIGHLMIVAAQLAAEEGLAEEGYRLVMNCKPGAGQTVFHIHLHVLGGRAMTWPPG